MPTANSTSSSHHHYHHLHHQQQASAAAGQLVVVVVVRMVVDGLWHLVPESDNSNEKPEGDGDRSKMHNPAVQQSTYTIGVASQPR